MIFSNNKIATAFVAAMLILFAYAPAGADPTADCSKCHKVEKKGKVVHAAVGMGCATCHVEPHTKNAKFSKGLSAEVPELCFGCHDKAKFAMKNIHSPVAGGMCTGCHDPHSSENAGLLISPAPDLCYNCHDKTAFSKKVVHMPVAGGMCTECHNPHSSELEKLISGPDICLKCHDKNSFTSQKVVHPPVAAGLCTDCHFPHSGDLGRMLRLDMPQLCYKCHDQKNFKKKNVHGPVEAGMCTGCHLVHQSKQEKLLTDPIPVLCYKCHRESPFNLKNIHAPVRAGLCMDCHVPHSTDFQPLLKKRDNAVCAPCHKAVFEEPHGGITGLSKSGHPLSAKRDPKRKGKKFTCTSCHNPHSSDWVKNFRYQAQDSFDICSNCHDRK